MIEIPELEKHRRAAGIDLGTTFSLIACVDNHGKPQIIPNAEGERITPSVILFDGINAIVGSIAQQNAMAEPEKIVDFVKREMGKSKEQFHRLFNGHLYSAQELSALIIKKLKNDAEKYLKEQITDVVITVPAYFNDAERTATVHAGQLAGLNVLEIINEPTAAALAYGSGNLSTKKTVFVFDLGGGTFDVTVMRIAEGHIQMLASNGDHRLGGKDWDDVICDWMAERFDEVHGDHPLLDLQSYQELYSRAVAAKIQLSQRDRTVLMHTYNGNSVTVEITRAEFERRSSRLLERCKGICEIVMQEAGLTWSDIDEVFFTGGMTRMPSVQQMVADISGGARIATGANADEAVAMGAAIQATLTMLAEGDITGEKPLPPDVRRSFSNAEGQLMRVSNITTHGLGVVLWNDEAKEEYVYPMIPKGTPTPAEKKNSFGLSRSGMQSLQVRVVEGESTAPGDCTPLGVCEVKLPPALPRGAAVALTYSYSRNQILDVVVEAYGRRSQVSIRRNAGLSEAELETATADLEFIRVS